MAEGVKAYDAVAADSAVEAELRSAARIRAAYLLVDTASLDELTKRVADLAVPGNAWRNSARVRILASGPIAPVSSRKGGAILPGHCDG